MSRKMPPYALRDWSLGLNNKDAENLISDQELVDVENAILGRGYIAKRHGYKKYTPAALANPIFKLYDFYMNDGTKEFLSVSNKTLYKDDNGTLNNIPFNTISSLTDNEVKMLTYKDRAINDVVLLADKGKLKVYDGLNVSEVTPHTASTDEQTDPGSNDLNNLTNFRAIAIKQDRIFAAAHPTVKNRISFCHHDQNIGYAVYDYWPAPFFFDVATDENDEITQLKVFRNALIVFCKRSIWVLYGDGRTINDYELNKVNVPSGCISPKSVQIVGNNMFYLSDDHIYSLFSTDQNYISAQIVSDKIENTLKSISRADKEKAIGTFFDNKYYLSFPSGLTLVYDTILQYWSKWTNIKANSFLDREGILYFSTDSGIIQQFDETLYNDDGEAIPFMMKTKNMDFQFEVQEKKFKRLWYVAKQYEEQSSTFNLQVVIDYLNVYIQNVITDKSLVWDEGNWDDTFWDWVEVVQGELKLSEKGKNIQLILTNNVIDEPLVLYGLVMIYKLKKP